jgi:ADP-heptose:LPS heptosyltransferase
MELAVRSAAGLSHASPAPPVPPAGSAAPPRDVRSLFVLRNNDIGDLLVVTPLFEALRRRFPEARIVAGVGSWNLPVLQHNPHLTEAMAVDAPWFNKVTARHRRLGGPLLYLLRSPQVREVARRRFEVGIDVLGSAWGSLLMLRAGIPYRLGVRGFAGGHTAVQAAVAFDPAEHVGRAALRFAELLGAGGGQLPAVRPQLFLTPGEIERAERWWAAGEGGARRTRVIVGPGGGLPEKRWPAASFVALAGALAGGLGGGGGLGGAGRGGLSLLVLAGPGEDDLAAAVASAAGARGFAEAPGLRETFALVAAADLVVCNSSMLMHAAAAFSKPTVVLLGEAFPSARRHQAQWGYAGTCRSLGREASMHEPICTPAAALAAVAEEIAALAAGPPPGAAQARRQAIESPPSRPTA